ncbi:MAG: hypothetical protein KAS32_13570 [Candidatus Peribacteraceae bacterium]|nr:hypothetical protein [Candidatus Peribacteraceae bacterium]
MTNTEELSITQLVEASLQGDNDATERVIDIMNRGGNIVELVQNEAVETEKEKKTVEEIMSTPACCIKELVGEVEGIVGTDETIIQNCFGFSKEVKVDGSSWVKFREESAVLSEHYATESGISPIAILPEKLWNIIIEASGLFRFENIQENGESRADLEKIATMLDFIARDKHYYKNAPEHQYRNALRNIINITPMIDILWKDGIDDEEGNPINVSFHQFEGIEDMADTSIAIHDMGVRPLVAIEKQLVNLDNAKPIIEQIIESLGVKEQQRLDAEKRIKQEQERAEQERLRNEARDPIVYTKEKGKIVILKQVGNFPNEIRLLDKIRSLTKQDIISCIVN